MMERSYRRCLLIRMSELRKIESLNHLHHGALKIIPSTDEQINGIAHDNHSDLERISRSYSNQRPWQAVQIQFQSIGFLVLPLAGVLVVRLLE